MKEEDIERIRKALNTHHKWPGVYMFKFIVRGDNEKVAQVQALFNSKTAQITVRSSSKGNFVSVTAREVMMSAEKVMEKYRQAAEIEGVMAL